MSNKTFKTASLRSARTGLRFAAASPPLSFGVRRRNLHMRILVALALTAAHGILVSLAGRLPESVAAVLAGTVYAPLWLASYFSLPVFGQAPSGGWPGPSILGWAFLAFTWFGAWLLAVSALKGLRP